MIQVSGTHGAAMPMLFLSLVLVSMPALAGPTVVPTAEGQIGETPGASDKVLGPRFEKLGGDHSNRLLFARLSIDGSAVPPPPEFQFLTDLIHGSPDPEPVGTPVPSPFIEVDKTEPASGWSRNAANDGDFVAFSFAVDGAMPETLTVRIATFDETGSSMVQVPVIEDIETFVPFLDPTFSRTGVAVDDQGRATVAYTELSMGLPRVKGTRLDVATGTPIDVDFLINDDIRADPDVALLDPAGNRLIIATNELVNPPTIQGNIVDFTGGTPVVLPDFLISNTPGSFGNINAAIAADPTTGNFTAVWENLDDLPGDPVNVRGRRFDAAGNPVGGDFVVNTTTANSQGQPAVAYGPENLSAIAWAGDGEVLPQDALDVFLQVYGPDGQPIGGEIKVNTTTTDVQDRPAVRFLPERDNQGQPQVAVAWRDVGTADGGNPNGTGASYKCFSITGFDEQVPIFADGFESGDTTSWSSSTP